MTIKNKASILQVPGSGILSPKLRAALATSADDFIAKRLNGCEPTDAALIGKLEKFYTSTAFAVLMRHFIELHFPLDGYLVVDPCAGGGAIADTMPADTIELDVDGTSHACIKANYLATEIVTNRPIAVVGNPPFRLAVEFFNHAAKQARVIAMIVPCTFRREEVLRELDDYFHLVAETEVPAWAFLRDGRPYNVPALLQIWERRSTRRVKPPKRTYHSDFTFASPEDAHFAVQRIGARAGLVHDQMHRSGEAHLFVKARDDEYSSYVEAMFNSIDMAAIAKNTSAVPYVNVPEIYTLYSELEQAIFGCSGSATPGICWTANQRSPRRRGRASSGTRRDRAGVRRPRR
ncbi:SAM-dependent methyltransferase [uncultured Sphingomonas sp.]|uniref:SAM-dependent methyltransferase n=1 Tax=uncultured Sphingomonas sp. TaxID=158754 RepID=UPI0025CEC138|nr:SAM-dependent methyltransferase [uncultured Sphingomonas sp.]